MGGRGWWWTHPDSELFLAGAVRISGVGGLPAWSGHLNASVTLDKPISPHRCLFPTFLLCKESELD